MGICGLQCLWPTKPEGLVLRQDAGQRNATPNQVLLGTSRNWIPGPQRSSNFRTCLKWPVMPGAPMTTEFNPLLFLRALKMFSRHSHIWLPVDHVCSVPCSNTAHQPMSDSVGCPLSGGYHSAGECQHTRIGPCTQGVKKTDTTH